MSSFDSITSNAASGLAAAQAGLAVLSDNIANAGVAGYTAKTLDQSAFVVGDQVDGVRTGLVSRSVDAALQASVWSSGSRVGQLTARSATLSAIGDTQGTPGDGSSLSDALANLQSNFTELQGDPSSQTQQSAVVAAAGTLANTITSTAAAITTQRNDVQGQIVSSVATLNTALATVQSTTHEIMIATASGGDTATLEDSRDAALQTISGLQNVTYDKQPSGDITILGQNGFSIPLDAQFSTSDANLSPSSIYAVGGNSVPAITMQDGSNAATATDVTSLLSGGQLGELVQLRDTTLPGYTSNLDAFSDKLATQLNSQGLALFTDNTGTANLTAYAGLSSQIQVNQAIVAIPSLVRDGTAGGNAAGLASYSTVIDAVQANGFSVSGVTSLSTDAQNFVTQTATNASQASADLASAQSYQTTVATKFSGQSGVNVDTELGLMIQLQNSYQANARVIQASQQLFQTLVAATTYSTP